LTPQLVAETVVYEAACQALEQSKSAALDESLAPEIDPDKMAELVTDMTKTLEKRGKVDSFAANPALVTTVAQKLAQSKKTGFFLKTPGNDREPHHVSVAVGSAKSKWVKELKAI